MDAVILGTKRAWWTANVDLRKVSEEVATFLSLPSVSCFLRVFTGLLASCHFVVSLSFSVVISLSSVPKMNHCSRMFCIFPIKECKNNALSLVGLSRQNCSIKQAIQDGRCVKSIGHAISVQITPYFCFRHRQESKRQD